MTAAICHASFVKVSVLEDSAKRVLSSGRCSVNADAFQVHVRILPRRRLDPEDSVWKTSIRDVPPADVMKFLGTVGRTHPVYLHHDKTKLRHLLHAVHRFEGLGNKCPLRPRVNILDYGIFLPWT